METNTEQTKKNTGGKKHTKHKDKYYMKTNM